MTGFVAPLSAIHFSVAEGFLQLPLARARQSRFTNRFHHADLCLQVRRLRPRQGRAAKDVRCSADGLPCLWAGKLPEAAHFGRFSAQRVGLVCDRFSQWQHAARPKHRRGFLRECGERRKADGAGRKTSCQRCRYPGSASCGVSSRDFSALVFGRLNCSKCPLCANGCCPDCWSWCP